MLKNSQDITNFVDEMLLDLNGKIKQKRWSDNEIREKYALRSSEEILNEGDIHYMNSCPDYSLLFFDYLNSKDADPKLIIQELFYKNIKRKIFHFAVQFNLNDSNYFVETIGFNKVSYGIGDYVGNRENVENLRIITLENKVDSKDNIIESTNGDLKKDLENFRNEHINYLIQANTKESYNAFIRKVGEAKLYLDNKLKNQNI